MRRRAVLVVGAGLIAGGGGLGAAWWRDRVESDPAGLWSLHLARPGGSDLAFAEFRGKPLLLNFWATWCPPCVTEMPLLEQFHQEHHSNGWHVVGIAVDQERPVQSFMLQRGITYPIALAGAEGLSLARSLGDSTGGLPFSIAFGADGKAVARKLGVLDRQTLAGWAAAVA